MGNLQDKFSVRRGVLPRPTPDMGFAVIFFCEKTALAVCRSFSFDILNISSEGGLACPFARQVFVAREGCVLTRARTLLSSGQLLQTQDSRVLLYVT